MGIITRARCSIPAKIFVILFILKGSLPVLWARDESSGRRCGTWPGSFGPSITRLTPPCSSNWSLETSTRNTCLCWSRGRASGTSGAALLFLKAYLKAVSESHLLPQDPGDLDVLLRTHLLEKAIYEIGYELNNRPDWIKIPLQGVIRLLEEGEAK